MNRYCLFGENTKGNTIQHLELVWLHEITANMLKLFALELHIRFEVDPAIEIIRMTTMLENFSRF